jgi:hypothetical protein
MFTQFFFLTGLAAVVFFFLGITLLAMSLFAESEAARRRLTSAQSVALLLLLALTAWTSWRLQQNLLPWAGAEPPSTASALLAAERESMTVMLLGLALVVNALLAAFAWVRIAVAGNALRSLLWALPGLNLVLGSKDLLGALQAPQAAGFAEVYAETIRSVYVSTGAVIAIVLFSWPAGWLVRRSALRSRPIVPLALLLVLHASCAQPSAAAAQPFRPDQEEILLEGAAPGWQAALVFDNGKTGIWTVKAFDVFPQYGPPEVLGLDDVGTCWILVSYSGKWTQFPVLHDGSWLGGLAHGDVDPRFAGAEVYVGSEKGNLYQIRAHPNGVVDGRFIGSVPGREIHTLVAESPEGGFEGRGLLVFTNPGGLYRLTPTGANGEFEMQELGDLPGRVRDAVILPRGTGDSAVPVIATVGREGALRFLRMRGSKADWEDVLTIQNGLGRIARGAPAGGASLLLYVTSDDGLVYRYERSGFGWTSEIIHRGAQGLRGIAAGRFDPDPTVETVACFGYDSQVILLSRPRGGAWAAQTLFTDRDKGHWLEAAELDGRNETQELLLCGYGGRIVLLTRKD